jgi:6-phospho-3-hexuloisomerase
MIRPSTKLILKEIQGVLDRIHEEEVVEFVEAICKATKIVCVGAGRVGNVVWGFSMRLGHLGFVAHTVGDSTTPSIRKGDLLIAASGSGETETIFHYVNVAKKNGARVALITSNPDSRMGRLADTVLILSAPSKLKKIPLPKQIRTIQPMTTLNEQCLQIFFDTLILELMKRLHQTEKHMWERHSNLE